MGSEDILIRPIAHIQTDFQTKFGVPRQSGLVRELEARVVFVPAYRSADALRGLEDFSHLWLLWQFSAAVREREGFSPTVRPPRLGGNERLGVFATRSPFRPNHIGLSCVELAGIEWAGPEAPALLVRGADLMDGTPILDVKPYLPYTDAYPEARGGFTESVEARSLRCEIPPELEERVPAEKRAALRGVLAQDPRPRYQADPGRVYGFSFAGREIRFRVENGAAIVVAVE